MKFTELVKHSVYRHGVIGCMRRGLNRLRRNMDRLRYLRERHIWYRLDLTCQRPSVELLAGFELVQGSLDDLLLVEQLGGTGVFEAERRLSMGVNADLWIVRNGQDAIFSCWIFRQRAPVLASRSGWLTLPADTVCMEDAITAPAYRGKGIAAAAWTRIGDLLVRQGVTAIIAKVEECNTASCRAVEKSGFRAIAIMDMESIWLKLHVLVRSKRPDEVSTFLIEQLNC
ncbi:MAG: GNAT family N-acetyltransferase [Gammaproteobacteria bacterium]